MVERFSIRHSCDGILYGKMAAWKNAETKGLFSLRLVLFLYSEKNMGLKPVWKCSQVQQRGWYRINQIDR